MRLYSLPESEIFMMKINCINIIAGNKLDLSVLKELLQKLEPFTQGEELHENNPLGKCCHKIIQDAIDKGLSMK